MPPFSKSTRAQEIFAENFGNTLTNTVPSSGNLSSATLTDIVAQIRSALKNPDFVIPKTIVPRPPVNSNQVSRTLPHIYRPHKKYPWFCSICGYAEHEQLQHAPRELDVKR